MKQKLQEHKWNVQEALPCDFERWMEFVSTVQEEFHGIDLVSDDDFRSVIKKNISRKTAIYVEDQLTKRIIGAMTYSPKSNHIAWLAVSPSKRRQGIGRALVEYMFEKFPKDTEIIVKTFLATDRQGAAAQNFYKSMGFKAREIVEDKDNKNAGHPFHIFVNEGRY